jgi:hypothetical protein
MTTPSAGSQAVLDAAAAAAAERDAAEQLELLPAGVSSDHPNAARALELVKRDRAGRPSGAQNKATKEIKDLCRRLFGDPMLESFRWAMHTPESLSALLGCTKLEAFDRLEEIRRDLRKFFYAPLAAIDGETGKTVPFFQLLAGGERAPSDQRPPWDYLDVTPQETQQKQALPQSAPAVSHGDVSHGEGK